MAATDQNEPKTRVLTRVGRQRVLGALAAWIVLAVGASLGPVGDAIDERLAMPTAFAVRAALGRAPELDPRLKIFSLDDSTYASLHAPFMSGETWAKIIRAAASAGPRAIVTTHMFGTGEGDDGRLVQAIRDARGAGVDVVAGLFAYPGQIQFRGPLDVERIALGAPAATPAAERPGHRLYGPDAPLAYTFTRLGHLEYGGGFRVDALERLAPGRVVPHVALAAGPEVSVGDDGAVLGTAPVRADGRGRVLVDWSPPAAYKARAKTMRLLLNADGEEPQRLIAKGDVVLLLSDMYTGRVSFVPTPHGPAPGGYVVATLLSEALRGHWLREPGGDLWLACAAAAAGVATALVATGVAFPLAVVAVTLCGIALALAAFALFGVLLPWIVPAVAYVGAAASVFGADQRRRLQVARQRGIDAEREAAKLNAIVRTAQMFAHDVRKPFSMLDVAVGALRQERDPARAALLLQHLQPELARATAAVEGMIQDVMEIDSDAALHAEATPVESLLRETLAATFALRPDAQGVLLEYRLTHSLPVMIDTAKIRRAVINVLENAVQAVGAQGRIWMRTRDVVEGGASFVELVIGNTGAHIPAEHIGRVFEAFFTSGKPGGTGLGLAIAHKVVTAHGGRIWCRSSRTEGTELSMTLPVAEATPSDAAARAELPPTGAAAARETGWPTGRRSSDRRQRSAAGRDRHEAMLPKALAALGSLESRHALDHAEGRDGLDEIDDDGDETARVAALDAALGDAARRLGRPLRVLLIDDEEVYLDALQTHLGALSAPVDWRRATTPAAALAAAAELGPDLIACDIDLGAGVANGFELVTQLRAAGCDARIVMHSNRVLPIAASQASLCGADGFLPKPVEASKVLEALLVAAQRPAVGAALPWIAVLDDSVFTLEAWQALVADARIVTFKGPSEFWQRVAAEPDFLARLGCVVTDLYFEEGERDDGLAFAARLKALANVPIVLSTDAELSPSDAHAVDAMISKTPESFASLCRRLRRSS
jgi:signal transduction histidine kinase/ActR/RegA family two-component response regulator